MFSIFTTKKKKRSKNKSSSAKRFSSSKPQVNRHDGHAVRLSSSTMWWSAGCQNWNMIWLHHRTHFCYSSPKKIDGGFARTATFTSACRTRESSRGRQKRRCAIRVTLSLKIAVVRKREEKHRKQKLSGFLKWVSTPAGQDRVKWDIPTRYCQWQVGAKK